LDKLQTTKGDSAVKNLLAGGAVGILIVLLLSGCASNMIWYKPDASAKQSNCDFAEARAKAAKHGYVQTSSSGDPIASGISAVIEEDMRRKEIVAEIMHAKGYQLIPRQQAEQIGSEVVGTHGETQGSLRRPQPIPSSHAPQVASTQVSTSNVKPARPPKVHLGILFENEQGLLADVKAGSPAARAGLAAGCTIVAVNGRSISNNATVIVDSEVPSKNPGDKVRVEWLDKAGNKVKKEIALEAP
jgi:S1-C subfamily serine protease